MKKKILGIVMALAMVLTMIPATAFADGGTPITEVNMTLKFDYESNTVTLESQDTLNYEINSDSSYLYFALKDGEIAYMFDDEEGDWDPMDDGESFEVLPDDAFDSYGWVLTFSPKEGFIFDNSIESITINNKVLQKARDDTDKIQLDVFNFNDETGDYLCINLIQDKPTKLTQTEDVIVDYTYLAESNTAEKVFNVTIDYTFPATLDAAGAQNTYTWDPTEGKYTKDETSTAESYTLSNEGGFEITVTNHSNVNIDYVVSYAANDAAVFANALDGDMTNATGTVNTIAQGHEVTADGINITNANTATADKTGDFNNATCTGKLKVTGINTGKTPAASGSDKLGTFTIGISEATAELCKFELEEGSSLYRIAAIDEDGIVYYTPYVYTSGKFVYDTEYKGGCATMPSEYAVENFGNDYAAGDFFHEDEEGNLVKCISPESHGINDNLIKIELINADGVTINYLFVLPETTYAYSNGKLSIIGVTEFGKSGYTCTLNGNPVPLSGELADGDYFKVVQEQNE